MRILVRNASLVGADGATALALDGDRIAWLGDEDGAAAWSDADRVHDLGGRLVTPAFVDAHAHVVQTGEQLDGLDLTGARDLRDLHDRVAAYSARHPRSAVVVGAGWDETTWPERGIPTAGQLERAAPGRRVYLARVDGHSAVVSHTLLAETPGIEECEGYTADGWLERDAKLRMTDRLGNLVGPADRLAHARTALQAMARLGIGAVHENAAPHIGPDWELDVVRRAATEVGMHLTAYWGAIEAWDDLARLDVTGLAGDLNADGAVGSRTAALRTPYADAPGRGHVFLDADTIAAHVAGCTERGIQAGLHCIGDAAMDAVGEGFAKAESQVGTAAMIACRHRLEHVEMPSAEVVGLLARLGVVASVQPMFDALWGGPHAMYADRLGDRWPQVNPFATLHAAGVPLAFGSDSPVTPLDPWDAVRAACHHRTPGQALPAEVAFDAHTRGGWYAARIDDAGRLAVGERATYAVWDTRAFPDLAKGAPSPRCLATVVEGRTIFEEDL